MFLPTSSTANDALADGVNRLLVVDSSLVNLGFVTLYLRLRPPGSRCPLQPRVRAGRTLGHVLRVREGFGSGGAVRAMPASLGLVSFESGTQDVTASVTVRWALTAASAD